MLKTMLLFKCLMTMINSLHRYRQIVRERLSYKEKKNKKTEIKEKEIGIKKRENKE